MKTESSPKLCAVPAMIAVLLPSFVLAYEVATHEDLSEKATFSSSLNKNIPQLGIKSFDDELTDIDTTRSIVRWIRKGANDEDDNISANFARYRHHFFDSQHGGRGLSGLAGGEPSPDWALEDIRVFTTQSYSFKKARQYFYDALTVQNRDNREQWMARTFYTLGHVIHHIQDMAQPQHTRNDSHGGGVFGPYSRFEKYTDLDTVRSNLPFSDINYNASSPVAFDSARKFWADNGRGIAEFSSYNFVSAGTNFDTNRYLYPALADAIAHDDNANQLLTSKRLPVPPQCLPSNAPCAMTFFTTHVDDKYRPAASRDNLRTSTSSIFDQDLKANNAPPVFSLNRFNFDAAHEFLIPRAVAYSAGLIDYFFRGRLAAEDVEFTDSGISLRVKNAIDPDKDPAWKDEALFAANASGQAGKLVVAVEYKTAGGVKEVGRSEPIDLAENLAPGQTSTRSYTFALSVPDDAKEITYRLVFRGKLGQEDDAVAVRTVRPGSGFGITPNYVPADGTRGMRAISSRNGRWLLDPTPVETANIDWKGQYVNGKPTKVLSWWGPKSRYFADRDFNIGNLWFYQSDFADTVYQNGEAFAFAPARVLGAAIGKDNGKEWLIVICFNGGVDTVYRRPNKKSESAELYDPVNNPNGWQKIGEYSVPNGSAAVPWFFNGSATEAQTMRYIADTKLNKMTRLKVRIAQDQATFESLGNLDGITIRYDFSNPDSGMPPHCVTGHHEWLDHKEFNLTYTGEYIVAVDYSAAQQGEQEILAKVNATGGGRSSVDTMTVWDIQQCGDPHINGSSDVGTTTGSATSTERIDRKSELVFGAERITIYRQTDTADGQSTYPTFHGAGSYGGVIPETAQLDAKVNRTRLGALLFLDLRYGLYVLDSQDETDHVTRTQHSATCAESTYHATEIVKIAYNGTIPVGERSVDTPNTFCRPAGEFSPGIFEGYINQGLSSQDPLVVEYPDPRRADRRFALNDTSPGGWAIDSAGNLLASQRTKFAIVGGETPYFNFLSGEKLEQLVSPAPADAHYFPIGVIR